MTEARENLLRAWRSGKDANPRDAVQLIHDLAQLDAYRVGLSQRGAMTNEHMDAIRDRQDYLARKEGRL